MNTLINKLRHLKFLLLICLLAIAPSRALAERVVDVSSPPSSKPGSFEEKVYKLLARAENLIAFHQAHQSEQQGENERNSEVSTITDSLVAMGPGVVPPVLNYLENELHPDVVSRFKGGSVTHRQHPEGRRFCTLILGRLGGPAAKAVVETLKRRLLNKRTFELNDEYFSVLAMIGQSSIKPIVQLAESSDAATSNAGLMILLAVLDKSDQYHVGEMPPPSSFMGFGGDWIDRNTYSESTLSASLPASLIPKLIDKSGKPVSIPLQDQKVDPKWATLPVYTALGMIDQPSRQVLDALKEGLKHRPHSQAYDVGYDRWRRAAMSVGRASLRDGNVLTDADADQIADELLQAKEDSGYGVAAAAVDALSMLAVRHSKYAQQVAHCISTGMMPTMSLVTVAGATHLMSSKDAQLIVDALINASTRANHNGGRPVILDLALANLDSRFTSKTVPVLINGWRYMNNDAGATPMALMQTGIAGKAAIPKLKELAGADDRFEYYYRAYRCLGCSAAAVLTRQTFADCQDSFLAHPHCCHLMADPDDPMYYASPDAPTPYSINSGDLMVTFISPDDLLFEALLEATPFIRELQRFRPADKIAQSVTKKTEEFRRTKALTYASKLYVKALQLYAKCSGDQRTLMADAVHNYALVLEATGKHKEATAMQEEFKKTGTLANVPR